MNLITTPKNKMNLITKLNDALRAILKRTKDKSMIDLIDPDTPVEMGKTRRTRETVGQTTQTTENAKGATVCAACGGEIVEVNANGTRACWKCGARVVD